MSESKAKRVLLPADVKPLHYTLTLTPDLEKFTFDGFEDVQFKLNTPTKIITTNAKNLDVHTGEVTLKNGKNLKASKIDYDKEKDYVLFHFDEEIDSDGTLKITFTGELNDKMCGFYRSQYTTKDGEKRYMGTTQFESTDARRAFPCWDEPSIKAVFQINLIVPEDRVALSCMNVIEEKAIPEKKQKLVRFADTPIMSTYYLAWVVGEFDYVEDKTSRGTVIRSYTPVGKSEQGKFALDVATRILPFYEDYFGEKFPLPKCDLVAIPDFSAGAMENWGCVTFRETAILADPKNTSAVSKQWIALVVCHELAHMWFGNLVTMEWWEHLWLNEGFATWVEYLAVEHLFPEWKIWEQFVQTEYGRAQTLDGLASSHPIEVDVSVASDIDQIFDAISYSKGCAVIRMLAEFLGLETFREGLRLYLTRHKYGNASTGDLWKALSEASGKDIGAMMHTWTRQTGYPVVTITEEKDEGNVVTFKVEQSRFLDSGIATNEQDQALWHIPFGYVTSANPDKPTWVLLTDKVSTITVDKTNGGLDWIKFNPQQMGFYRAAYADEKYLQKLVPAIESRTLGDIDRLGVQNDVFSLARSGRTRTSHALSIVKAYANETNYTVWAAISTNLDDIWSLVSTDPEIAPKFEKFAQNLFAKKGAELGWEPATSSEGAGESHLTSMLRALMVRNLVKYNHPETAQAAVERFHRYLEEGPQCVVPDLRGSVYAAAIKNGGEKEYEEVLKVFRTTDLQEERIRCITALGSTRDKKLIQRTLDFGLSEEVRSQDTMYVMLGVSSNPLAFQGNEGLVWEFFKQHFDEFARRYGEGGFMVGRIIKFAAGGFLSEERAAEVERFFQEHPLPNARMPIQQCLESIRLNAAWLQRDREDIKQWLDANC